MPPPPLKPSQPIDHNPPIERPNPEYTSLLTALSQPDILSIEILPLSHASTIQTSGSALGIPKPLLLSSFVTARSIFLSHLRATPTHIEPLIKARRKEIWHATTILTLFDPEFLSAWSFRKRALLEEDTLSRNNVGNYDEDEEKSNDTPPHPHLPGSSSSSSSHPVESYAITTHKTKHLQASTEELHWTESLLTSPLPRHAKSATLWSHRRWLFRTFPSLLLRPPSLPTSPSPLLSSPEDEYGWLQREINIIMRAAETHGKNYWAWEYARGCFRVWDASRSIREGNEKGGQRHLRADPNLQGEIQLEG
ncbi:MAG: hypothetical protein Q9220_004024 [cf. Caloplaca sp. 1 TL-2023]